MCDAQGLTLITIMLASLQLDAYGSLNTHETCAAGIFVFGSA
jgi:hypothetical protein